jgi:hypothetical protein
MRSRDMFLPILMDDTQDIKELLPEATTSETSPPGLWNTFCKLLGTLTYYLAAYVACVIGLVFVILQLLSAYQYLKALYSGNNKLAAAGYGLVASVVTVVVALAVYIVADLDE